MKSVPRSGSMLTVAWSGIALAFPWSNAFMSMATGVLALAVLRVLFRSEGQRDKPKHHFWSNLTGWMLVALVAYSATSSLWSDLPNLALHDARIKLPLLVGGMALLASGRTGGLSVHSMEIVLKCAVVSAVLATVCIVCMDLLEGFPFGGRQSSRFISHIRFGLWWAVLLPWIAIALPRLWLFGAVFFALVAWTWTESLTGLLAGYVAAVWWLPVLWSRLKASSRTEVFAWPVAKMVGRRGLLFGAAALVLSVGIWKAMPTNYPDPSALAEFSNGGERYVHFEKRRVTENGNLVWTHIAWGELADAWRKRHPAPFQEIKGPLVRFLSSKGLRKDREGVLGLSLAELDAIASGIPSVVEWKGVGWARRWNRICFNWGNGIDGVGKSEDSILSRGTYQSAAWLSISGLPFGALVFGAGTGSQQGLMNKTYARQFKNWPVSGRKRPHNQFLSLVLGMGLLGLFMWCLTLSIGQGLGQAWSGLLLLFLSCLGEDTLETQAGVTLALWVLAFPAFTRSVWPPTKPPLRL